MYLLLKIVIFQPAMLVLREGILTVTETRTITNIYIYIFPPFFLGGRMIQSDRSPYSKSRDAQLFCFMAHMKNSRLKKHGRGDRV